MSTIYTPLKSENNLSFRYRLEKLKAMKEELEYFVESTPFVNQENFTKKVLFPYEVKSNNAIEGYNEDITSIISIMDEPNIKKDNLDAEYQRIVNLYRGYKYILKRPSINEDNLFHLYRILSKNLLEGTDRLQAGHHYRSDEVFIFFSNNPDVKPDHGVDYHKISNYMNVLFEYINEGNDDLSTTDKFIKSQIIHFYFVYIHPYFDINGRTSRTTGIWYLNNNEAYPYTLFNRGINLKKGKYYEIIRTVKKYHDLTPFLAYMLEQTKTELEKEYIIDSINSSIHGELTPINRQTLHYILSNRAGNTLLDLVTLYNRFNPKKKAKSFKEEMLDPLIDLDIVKIKRETSKSIAPSSLKNFEYTIDNTKIDNNPSKIKRLKLNKMI